MRRPATSAGCISHSPTGFIITTPAANSLCRQGAHRGREECSPLCIPLQLFEVLVAEFQRGLIAVVLELTDELNQIEDLVYGSELRDENAVASPRFDV